MGKKKKKRHKKPFKKFHKTMMRIFRLLAWAISLYIMFMNALKG